jgi:hypothetical protein
MSLLYPDLQICQQKFKEASLAAARPRAALTGSENHQYCCCAQIGGKNFGIALSGFICYDWFTNQWFVNQ